MGTHKCCVGGCNATSESHRLFSFPKNDELRNLWLSFLVPSNSLLIGLTKEQLLRKRVCEKHFDQTQFDDEGRRLRHSYPCLFTIAEISQGVPLSTAEWDIALEHNYYKEHNSEEDVTEPSLMIGNIDTMGNKRKLQEKEEARVAKKIKKLGRKLQRRRRVTSADDSDSKIEEEVLPMLTPSSSPVATLRASPYDHTDIGLDMPSLISSVPLISPHVSVKPISVDPEPSTATDVEMTNRTLNQEEETELEEAVLQILGEAPQPDLALGKDIREDIASRWQQILLKGLPKEVKETILKKYPVPANCNFLVAPILNSEAKAAVPDILVKTDATLSQKQNQIGVALAALSQLTEMILRNETSKQVLLQPLSDACRILCDSHNTETKTRQSIILSSTNSSLRDVLANAGRDKYLFGEDLAEKLKVATVQKTGESLLINNPVPSSSKGLSGRSNPKNRNLNSTGPIQRKPPIRKNKSSRARPLARQSRNQTYSRPPGGITGDKSSDRTTAFSAVLHGCREIIRQTRLNKYLSPRFHKKEKVENKG